MRETIEETALNREKKVIKNGIRMSEKFFGIPKQIDENNLSDNRKLDVIYLQAKRRKWHTYNIYLQIHIQNNKNNEKKY